MRFATLPLAASLIWIALVGAAPQRGVTKCLRGPFRGITATSETGERIGEVDRFDWGCTQAASGSVSEGPGRANQIDADVPVPPPQPGICLLPAAPNPTQGSTRFQLTLGEPEHVRLTIHGQHWRHGPLTVFLVRTLLDGDLRTGTYEVLWDGKDDQGERVPPGIYRLVLESGDQSLCGDVEVR